MEAGGNSNFWIHVPVGFTKTLNNPGQLELSIEPEENVSGRQIPIPEEEFWSGSSSINGMPIRSGPSIDDYNVWELNWVIGVVL